MVEGMVEGVVGGRGRRAWWGAEQKQARLRAASRRAGATARLLLEAAPAARRISGSKRRLGSDQADQAG